MKKKTLNPRPVGGVEMPSPFFHLLLINQGEPLLTDQEEPLLIDQEEEGVRYNTCPTPSIIYFAYPDLLELLIGRSQMTSE